MTVFNYVRTLKLRSPPFSRTPMISKSRSASKTNRPLDVISKLDKSCGVFIPLFTQCQIAGWASFASIPSGFLRENYPRILLDAQVASHGCILPSMFTKSIIIPQIKPIVMTLSSAEKVAIAAESFRRGRIDENEIVKHTRY